MRHSFPLVLSSVWIAAVTFGPVRSNAALEPLNVVLILVDDLGWSDLGCYGSDLHETPHIDRLAGQSMRFTAAYAAAAICSPTRASIMTGKYPARLGMTIWHEYAVRGPDRDRTLVPPEAVANLPRSEITLAETLGTAGYRTLHVGKWHLGNAEHYPETQGFDVNVGGSLWGAPATFFWPYRGPFGSELRYVPGLVGGETGEYLTDRLTGEALKLVTTAGDRPFFLNLWFHTVHTPIEGKPDLVTRYEKKVVEAGRHRHATYAAMVHSLDENVGRVLARLDELGLAGRTLVILTSDNGGVVHRTSRWGVVTDNFPLRSGKGSLYEGGVRVPLIVRWPGVVPAGSVCTEPVATQDLYPTILEALGVAADPAHGPIDGESIVRLLRDPASSLERDALYWHYPHYYPTTTPVSAVRSGRHKLLHFYEDDRVELYDLSADAGESRNLASSRPETAAMLRRKLELWLTAIGARMPRLAGSRR